MKDVPILEKGFDINRFRVSYILSRIGVLLIHYMALFWMSYCSSGPAYAESHGKDAVDTSCDDDSIVFQLFPFFIEFISKILARLPQMFASDSRSSDLFGKII